MFGDQKDLFAECAQVFRELAEAVVGAGFVQEADPTRRDVVFVAQQPTGVFIEAPDDHLAHTFIPHPDGAHRTWLQRRVHGRLKRWEVTVGVVDVKVA